jgi:hypothetical protein
MKEIKDYKSFQAALSDLSVSDQRQISARFIAHVLDLTENPRLKDAQQTAMKPDLSAEELMDTYHRVHTIYVQTHPRSDLSEVDYTKQAVHFITEACLVCLSPTYPEAKIHRIAEKAAMYCRMARTCANILHDEDQPNLENTAKALQKEIEVQYQLVNQFLNG